MNSSLSIIAASTLLTLLSPSIATAATTIQIVADNDFAVYAGTATSITREIYQNAVGWPSQLTAASSFSFTLDPGETTYYLLAMGGGGEQENISGKINDVNIVDVFQADSSAVQVSVPIQDFLSGAYSLNLGPVADGSYTPTLSSVQAALAGTILAPTTFGAPTVNTTQTVITQNPEALTAGPGGVRSGFSFVSEKAVFYRFSAASVPEPSSATLLMGLGLLGLVRRRR